MGYEGVRHATLEFDQHVLDVDGEPLVGAVQQKYERVEARTRQILKRLQNVVQILKAKDKI